MRQCISVWVFHDSDHQLISSDCSQVKYSLKFYCLDFQVRGFVGVGFFFWICITFMCTVKNMSTIPSSIICMISCSSVSR